MSRTLWACVVVCAMTGCAHTEFKAPDAPAEETAMRLADLTTNPRGSDEALCAAERVELERSFTLLQARRGTRPTTVALPNEEWFNETASSMNLSQASEAMGQAYAASRQTPPSGDAAARARVLAARAQFDAFTEAAARPGTEAEGRFAATPEQEQANAALYATVWTAFFSTPSGHDDHDVLLEWLTARSNENLSLLRAYHDEFRLARDNACG